MRLLLIIIAVVCAMVSCAIQVTEARKLHVGAVLFPEHGHFAPLSAIIQACLDRGDDVTIFSPTFFIPKEGSDFGPKNITAEMAIASKGAKVSGGVVRYVSFCDFNHNQYDDSFFSKLVEKPAFETLEDVNQHMRPFLALVSRSLKAHFDQVPEDIPDVFLVDYPSNSATFVAEYLKIPAVICWPMTLSFPFSTNFFVPFMSLGLSADQPFLQRFFNIFIYAVARIKGSYDLEHPNMLRAELGLPPADVYNLLGRHPVITPSVLGFDISQPLCPNVFPVGMLLPDLNGTMDEDFSNWLDKCERVVYINMGSVAVLPERWDAAIMNFSVRMANKGTCVVWKRRMLLQGTLAYEAVQLIDDAAKARFRVVRNLPFSPRFVLRAKTSKVFITHCGDTSVFEAIESHAPMVGIPLFADQPDVCARIKDSRVGTYVHKNELTADLLEKSVEETFANEKVIIERLAFMHSTAKVQGLAPRAAEVIHFVASLGFDGAKALNCKHIDEPWYRVYDLDVMVGLSAIVWTVLIAFYYAIKICCCCRCCCCRCCCCRKKRAAKQKVD